MIPTNWRAEFQRHYTDTLTDICETADARMCADPTNCRAIRLEASAALAELDSIQPCAHWPTDQQAAFAIWLKERRQPPSLQSIAREAAKLLVATWAETNGQQKSSPKRNGQQTGNTGAGNNGDLFTACPTC